RGIEIADAETFARVPGIFMPSHRWADVGLPVRFDATINRLGYRGQDVDPGVAAGALRVLFVGDSFAFGMGVEDDETWPARLGAPLTCDRPVVVYNAGVPGGGLPDEIAMTERAVPSLRPDAVVVEFTGSNDVTDLVGPTYWSRMVERQHAGWLRDHALRALARSGLWNLLRRARDMRQTATRWSSPPDVLAAARARYAEMLTGWAARLRADQVPLLFVAYPSFQTLKDGQRGLQDWVLATARQAGLEPVDLWPVLSRGGRPPDDLFLVPQDTHPTPAGYDLAARATAVALRGQVPAFAACRAAGPDNGPDRSE